MAPHALISLVNRDVGYADLPEILKDFWKKAKSSFLS